jgi:hypothetical protein
MTSSTADIPSLASLDYISYLDDGGELTNQFEGQVGVYAVFDQEQVLQFVGYSRDVYLSLKQHLVRQPQCCYWIKVQTIDRPSRTILEGIRDAWIAENGAMPAGNGPDTAKWTQPIDAKAWMSPEETNSYTNAVDEMAQVKLLKQVARRVEAEILAALKLRGVQTEIRFNPKLKEQGLLDLK